MGSRMSCLILVALGVMWIPVIQNLATSQLFIYMQQVQNILSPPLSAVFLLANLWPRANEPVSCRRPAKQIHTYMYNSYTKPTILFRWQLVFYSRHDSLPSSIKLRCTGLRFTVLLPPILIVNLYVRPS